MADRHGFQGKNGFAGFIVDPTDRPVATGGKAGAVKVPMVRNIKLMNQPDDRVVILMLGEELPLIGTALTADEARHLAMSLMTHADALPQREPATAQNDDDEEEHRG